MLSESTAGRAFALLDRHAPAWLEILRRWYVVSDRNPLFVWEAIRLATVLPSSGGIPAWCIDYLRGASGALVATLREDEGAHSTVPEALGLTSARRSVADAALKLRDLTVLLGQYERLAADDGGRGAGARAREEVRRARRLQGDAAVQARITDGRKIVARMVEAGGGNPTAEAVREAAMEVAFLADLTAALADRLAEERNGPGKSYDLAGQNTG